ncbi:MAG: hypothetical protein WB557_14005 [Solirubrobacteraceae bacterium]
MISRARLTLVAAAAAGGVGELVRRRRRVARNEPPPPLTTQSSPGQIADLQQAYGADMAPRSSPSPAEATAAG